MTAAAALVGRRRVHNPLRLILGILLSSALIAAAVGGTIRISEEMTPLLVVAVPVLLLAGAALFLLPVHILPTMALVIFALVPMRVIPSDGPFNALPPLSALLIIWVMRRVVLGQSTENAVGPMPDRAHFGARYAVFATAGLFFVWCLLGTIRAGGVDTSVGWTIAFTASVLLALLVFDARREAALLQRTWIVLGGLLGLYTVVELVLQASPVYQLIYTAMGFSTDEVWSVYRAEASFGHPLFAGAFLSIPAALGVGSWIRTGRIRDLLWGMGAAAGVAATVSRGSIAAVAIAIVVIGLAALLLLGRRVWLRLGALAGIAAVGAVALLNFEPLLARQDSAESALSAGARDRALEVALEASAYSGWLGTGPGTSGETGRLFDDVIIENSILQLMISVGIPGLVLFLAFIVSLVAAAAQHRNVAAIGAVVAYTISISGFNSIDALRSMHLVIGLLVILAVNAPAPLPNLPDVPPSGAARRVRPGARQHVGGTA